MKAEVKANVKPGAVVLADEAKGYTGLQGTCDHCAVNHSAGEYVRLFFIHANGLENAWPLFKRQVYGIHHWISAKHVDRYLGEFTFRCNSCKTGEGERVNTFLGRVEGRLTYKALISWWREAPVSVVAGYEFRGSSGTLCRHQFERS